MTPLEILTAALLESRHWHNEADTRARAPAILSNLVAAMCGGTTDDKWWDAQYAFDNAVPAHQRGHSEWCARMKAAMLVLALHPAALAAEAKPVAWTGDSPCPNCGSDPGYRCTFMENGKRYARCGKCNFDSSVVSAPPNHSALEAVKVIDEGVRSRARNAALAAEMLEAAEAGPAAWRFSDGTFWFDASTHVPHLTHPICAYLGPSPETLRAWAARLTQQVEKA